MQVPAYIEARIRRPPPPGCCVVTGSTPVVSFGNAQSATVATLGLNPSSAEFMRRGQELVGDARRLATHSSLGTNDLANAPIETIAEVLADCNGYFQRRPYWWFNTFAPILDACGASFDDGSACHLDLIQWATEPIWSRLDRDVREGLIAEDATFLAEQLQNEQLQLLLANGRGVLNGLRPMIDDLKEVDQIIGLANFDTKLYAGTICGRVRVVAWTTNLQAARCHKEDLLAELAGRVSALAD